MEDCAINHFPCTDSKTFVVLAHLQGRHRGDGQAGPDLSIFCEKDRHLPQPGHLLQEQDEENVKNC